jgi:hypothetical protein
MVKNVKVGGAPVQTFAEWNALPEISFPVLRSDSDEGSTYAVRKVGWLLADRQDCRGIEIPAVAMAAGKVTLPTAVVMFDGEPQLCKLPIELGAWAFDQVAFAHSGHNLFPANVEFGVLDGRHYAEIL